MMDTEIHLVCDGDGVAIVGDPAVLDHFLGAQGLASKDFGLPRLDSALSAGAGMAQASSEIAANSGRWVKLTEKSAKALKTQKLLKGSERGVSRAVLTENGTITGILELARTPGAFLTIPAILAGVAGVMAQLAMQQAMDEVTDDLATIDQKVDDVCRAQKDAVLADMIAVGLVIEEAMTVRDTVGGVSETTWSKVQGTSMTIARTQAYALRRLDALAEKVGAQAQIRDLGETVQQIEPKVEEWLAVLARCFQLNSAIAVLELDRVLAASPDELDRHRLGLKTARARRLELIAQRTAGLMARMDAAARRANSKVLLHPFAAREVVSSRNYVASAIAGFHQPLGIENSRHSVEAKRWVEAATETRDKVLDTGADGVDVARRVSSETLDRARSATGRLSNGITRRVLRRRQQDDEQAET